MKGYIITLNEEGKSEPLIAANNCIQSIRATETNIEATIFDATTPVTINEGMKEAFGTKVQWNWPMDESANGYDLSVGMFKKNYPARDQLRVVACAVSHARLWKLCVDLEEPICILEQDARFINKFSLDLFDGWEWGAVGLNDPRGATRKSKVYYDMIVAKNINGVIKVPDIDTFGSENLPMGLAGNSAYVIKPWAAKELLEKAKKVGLWPNDALMCKQFFPWLKVCYPFYTNIQGLKSTTTG